MGRSLFGLTLLAVGIINMILSVFSHYYCDFANWFVRFVFRTLIAFDAASFWFLLALMAAFFWKKLKLPKKVLGIYDQTRKSKLDLE